MEGLLIVHFGSSVKSARDRALDPITKLLGENKIYEEAYTSKIIRKKLDSMGIHKMNIEEATKSLINRGCNRIKVKPTLLINGIEYMKLVAYFDEIKNEYKDVE